MGDLALDATVDGSSPSSPSSHSGTDVGASSRIGRYAILRKLGEGGMGVVYAAYDEELDRRVAVKLLRDGKEATPERRKRILREAQAMARVSHPNVISVYEVGEMNGRVFIAMEYVEGTTLSSWQEAPGRTWSDILRVYLQAAEGLLAAHQAGLVHRDFKPDNVLVGSDGRPRVADFGLARAEGSDGPESAAPLAGAPPAPEPPAEAPPAGEQPREAGLLDSQLTVEGAILGTPAYMSPEQHRGQPADSRSDAWSFCVALYEALFQQMPFPGDTMMVMRFNLLQGRLRPPPQKSPVPRQLERALRRGLSADPAQRFPTMRELITALSVDTLRDPSAAPLSRRIFTISLAGTILVSALVLSWFWLRGTLSVHMLFVSALVSLLAAGVAAFSLRRTLLKNAFHRALVKQVLIAITQITVLMGIADRAGFKIEQVYHIDMVIVGGVLAQIAVTTMPSAGWVVLLCLTAALIKVTVPSLLLPLSVACYPMLTIALAILWSREARRHDRGAQPSLRQRLRQLSQDFQK